MEDVTIEDELDPNEDFSSESQTKTTSFYSKMFQLSNLVFFCLLTFQRKK